MRKLIFVIWMFVIGVQPQWGQSCKGDPGIPALVRADGMAERAGDLYLRCNGGPGGPIFTTDIVLTFNVPVTSATPGGFPEALLLVDEPAPGSQLPGVNLFQASSITGNQIRFQAVRLSLPGSGHFLRFTNLRVNASALQANSSVLIVANVAMSHIDVSNSEQGLSYLVLHTPETNLWDGNAQGSGGVALPQCNGQNTDLLTSPSAAGSISLTVNFSTVSESDFRTRNIGGATTLQPQDLLRTYMDAYPNSESAYYAPSLPSTNNLNQAGLATQGTRLMVRFSNVPVGIKLFVTTTPLFSNSARLIQTDANGMGPYSPVAGTGTTTNYLGQTLGIAPVTLTNGSAQAVWEVTSTPAPSLTFGVLIAYQAGVPPAGTVTIQQSFAPISTETGAVASPVPRFAGLDVFPHYFSIYSCSAGRPDLTVTSITAPSSAFEHASIAVSGTVQNLGGPVTGPFRGEFRFYADPQGMQPSPYPVTAGCQISSLAAGASAICSANLDAPWDFAITPGYIGLAIDRFQDVGESNETNNLSVLSTPVTIVPCNYALSSAGANFSKLGGSGSFNVTTDPGCPRNPAAGFYWITVTSPPAYGSGAIAYTVAANMGALARESYIFVGARVRYRVTQAVGSGPNEAPRITGLTPNGGTGSSQTFAASFTDANIAYIDIAGVEVLIGSTTSAAGACYVRFDPTGTIARLVGDDGIAASAPLVLGGAGFVENSQCRLTASGSSWGGGSEMTLALNLSFKAGFAGKKNVFLSATDLSGASTGWSVWGTWTVSTGAANVAPIVVSRTPESGNGSNLQLTVTFADGDGWQDMDVLNVLINDFLDGRHACYIAYSRPLNVLYLVNDAGDALLPGLVLNGTGSIGNSQCTIQGAGSSANGAGSTLVLSLNLSFKPAFSGYRVFYAAAGDLAANNTGWQAILSYGVAPTPVQSPGIASSVVFGGNQPDTFTLSVVFTDNDGWEDLDVLNILINDFLDGRHACYLAYSRPLNVLYLVNDAGDALLPGLLLNGSGSIGNSQCTIVGTESLVEGFGSTLHLLLKMRTASSFHGYRVAYLAARDLAQHNSGWHAMNALKAP